MRPRLVHPRRGFTLIELLLVLGIIGVLASLALARYDTVRRHAYYAAMRTDLRNLLTAMELHREVTGGYQDLAHPANTTAANGLGFQPSANVTVLATSVATPGLREGYTVSVQHVRLGAGEYCAYAIGGAYADDLAMVRCTTAAP